MTVYIVVEYDYENTCVVGVYQNEEEAQSAVSYHTDKNLFLNYDYTSWEVQCTRSMKL